MATPTTLPAEFTAGQVLTAAQMNDLRGAFRVLQVVSVAKTDTFTTSSASLVDITGLAATITPSSASSLVLVTLHIYGGANATGGGVSGHIALFRGATQIGLGDAAGNRSRVFSSNPAQGNTQDLKFLGGTFLDTPNTTSATTYKTQTQSGGAFIVTINREGNDADSAATPRTISTITLMEISA
jgi:hypothetical protein